MKVQFRPSNYLPRGVDAALVEGDRETTILLRAEASAKDIAAALDELVGADWAPSSWIYVGDCLQDSGLRSTG